MRVLALTKYSRLGASSRLRFLQYFPFIEEMQCEIQVLPLLSDSQLAYKYKYGKYETGKLLESYVSRIRALVHRRRFDVIWIEKEALQWLPLWLELALLTDVPYVLDYDDAVFHHYDQHRFGLIRILYGKRLDGLMSRSALVIAGNDYLASRARQANACHVEILPTVIDLQRYQVKSSAAETNQAAPLKIVWIGSPSTVRYLELLREPLKVLANDHDFCLRVIGGKDVHIPGVDVETLEWNEDTEVDDILACDLGVMPLLDSDWERGKCGYKLIQYMACGLPVVASPIGVNVKIVQDNVSGYLAATPQEWVDALRMLLESASLRQRMGSAGRAHVESEFCVQKTAPRLASLLLSASKSN